MPIKDYVIIAALCWFVARVIRDPGDRALRLVVAALAAQLLGEAPVVAALRMITDGAITAAVAKVLQNVALATTFYCLLLFFLMSAAGFRRRTATPAARRARRRAWIELGVLGLTVVMFCTTVALTPSELRATAYPPGGDIEHAALWRPEVAAFYALGQLYFAWGAVCAGWWALAYARESSRRSRIGLRVAAAGMGVFVLAFAARGSFAALRYAGVAVPDALTTIGSLGVDVGVICYVGGAVGVAVATRWAAARVWLRHRRDYDVLRPLWSALHDLFPDDALEREDRGLLRDRLSPRRVHHRFWRRSIEIRDGLVRLSPHLAEAGWSDTRPVHEQAELVAAAMQRYRSGVAPQSPAAVRILVPPPGSSIDDDVRRLVELSRAFGRTSAPASFISA